MENINKEINSLEKNKEDLVKEYESTECNSPEETKVLEEIKSINDKLDDLYLEKSDYIEGSKNLLNDRLAAAEERGDDEAVDKIKDGLDFLANETEDDEDDKVTRE